MKTIFINLILLAFCFNSCQIQSETITDIEKQKVQTKGTGYGGYIHEINEIWMNGNFYLKMTWTKPSPIDYADHIQFQYYKDRKWNNIQYAIQTDGIIGTAKDFPSGQLSFRLRGILTPYDMDDDEDSKDVTPWSNTYTFNNTPENATVGSTERVVTIKFEGDFSGSKRTSVNVKANLLKNGNIVKNISFTMHKDFPYYYTAEVFSDMLSGYTISVENTDYFNSSCTWSSTSQRVSSDGAVIFYINVHASYI